VVKGDEGARAPRTRRWKLPASCAATPFERVSRDDG
jgi:hypothetical protein